LQPRVPSWHLRARGTAGVHAQRGGKNSVAPGCERASRVVSSVDARPLRVAASPECLPQRSGAGQWSCAPPAWHRVGGKRFRSDAAGPDEQEIDCTVVSVCALQVCACARNECEADLDSGATFDMDLEGEALRGSMDLGTGPRPVRFTGKSVAGSGTAGPPRNRLAMWYPHPMPLSLGDLNQRLAEADRARCTLRRATLEWRALGLRLLRARRHEDHDHVRPDRPDGDCPAGRSSPA